MLQSLQAGRALAALMVLGFHLGLAIRAYFGVDSLQLPWGHAGVEFFFVLSGFIIMTVHRQDVGQPRQLGRFLYRRFIRIYPIYWLVFLVAFAGAFRIVNLTPLELLRALVLVPADVAPVISVAWSLQWEVVFYLLFGAFIVNRWLGLLATVLAGWVLPEGAEYFALFGAGLLCAWAYQRRWQLPGPALAALGLALFASACVYDAITGHKPTLWLGLGAAVLILGLATAERAGTTYGEHWLLQRLGDASYAIYLVHYPLISAGCKVAMLLGLRGEAWGLVSYTALLLASIGVGVGLNLWVEKPMVQALARLWRVT